MAYCSLILSDSDSDSIVLLLQDTFILFRLRVSHLHDSFVFRSILLSNISFSRVNVVFGPPPPPKNDGGVQQPFLRTPTEGILPI